jgi:hypothetical protein
MSERRVSFCTGGARASLARTDARLSGRSQDPSRSHRLPLLLLALFLSVTSVTSAQETDAHSQNMKLLASLPKSGVTNSGIAFLGNLA